MAMLDFGGLELALEEWQSRRKWRESLGNYQKRRDQFQKKFDEIFHSNYGYILIMGQRR